MATLTYHSSKISGTAPQSVCAPADPLLSLLNQFKAQAALLDASDENDPEDAAIERRFLELWDRLTLETPECTSVEGAAAALRYVADDMEGNINDMQHAILASVSAFMRTREEKLFAKFPAFFLHS